MTMGERSKEACKDEVP